MKNLSQKMVRAAAIFFVFFLGFSIQAGAATVRVGGGGTASRIGGMITVNTDARVGKITAGEDATVRISSVNIRNSDLGGDFQVTRAESEVGTVSVSNRSHLNVTSVNIQNAATNGRVNLDMRANIQEIDISNDSNVSIGSFNIGTDKIQIQSSNNAQKQTSNNLGLSSNYPSILPIPPPQYLPSINTGENSDFVDYVGLIAAGLTRNDEDWQKYGQNYELALGFYNEAMKFKLLAEKALREGDSELSQKYKDSYLANLAKCDIAKASIFAKHFATLEEAKAYARFVYETSKLSAELLAAATGNPRIQQLVTGVIISADYFVNKSEYGKAEAQKQLLADVMTEMICHTPVDNGKTIQDILSSPYQEANTKILQKILKDENVMKTLAGPLGDVLVKLEEEGTKTIFGKNATDLVKDALLQLIESS